MTVPPPENPILLYDGVCGLCNGLIRFVLRRDREARLRFAPLQSELAREILVRHGRDPDDLDTVVLVSDPGAESEALLDRARAILRVMSWIGWPWKALMVFWPLPTFLIDAGYRFVAWTRYRLFGRHEKCPLPTPEERARFLGFDLSGETGAPLQDAAPSCDIQG